MYKHQEQFLKITQEYNRQISLLLGMAEKANRKQIERLTPILQKLKSSLQKLINQQERFKQCVHNPGKYKALLQPYISLLDETKAEIEVITPELWAVNSGYIKAGWIRELSPVPGLESVNKYASLTNDGIMILKKESEFYPILKQLVPKIMLHTDEELQLCHKLNHKAVLDDYEKLYLNVMEWEIERRRVRADYLNRFPRPTLKNRIRKLLQKVGEKFGYYQNSD